VREEIMTEKPKKNYRLSSDIPPWGIEMHKALDEIASNYRLDSKDYLTFLVAALTEEVIKQDYSEEDVILILNGIFDTYAKVKTMLQEKGLKKD
jgi:hypothetical protein